MRSLLRIWRIGRTVTRHRLDELAERVAPQRSEWPRWLKLLVLLNPLRLTGRAKGTEAARLRQAMEELGPVFVKFGQILSTRRDLLPPAFADELARLQDQVPPFPGDEARRIIEAELGASVDMLFAEFDETPLASASVAQVHPARLLDGREVVVKVIRPDIETVIREDLVLLHFIARFIEKLGPELRRLHPVQIVADYERTILEELCLDIEAANTDRLRHNFQNSELLYVPLVEAELTRTGVLTLERVNGVPIANIEALKRAGTDMEKLANRGVETFFRQVFVDNFFHADMHPGNIFVDISDPADPSYIAIDCAIMGELTAADQDYLARNLVAFFNQDYREVARLHVESGWVPADTNTQQFERVIRSVCEPIFHKPLKEISFGYFLITLFQTARRFEMEVQPQLVLLQKTLLNIEGLGRQLYPDLDLWQTAKPFMEQWVRDRANPLHHLRAFASDVPALLTQLPMLPRQLVHTPAKVAELANAQQQTNTALGQLIELEQRRGRAGRRWGLIAIIGAAALYWLGDTQHTDPLLLAAVAVGAGGAVLLARG